MTRSAEQAEAGFYDAFENGDLEGMASVWAFADDVVCVHPNGSQIVGYDRVMESWREILANTGNLSISVTLLNEYSDGRMAVRFVSETLSSDAGPEDSVTVLATNAYRKTEAGWRIILHHASPGRLADEADDPDDDLDEGRVTVH